MADVSKAINIADLRLMARARLPRMVFDYIDGGADDERTLSANYERLRAHRLVWDALVDVSRIDLATRVMGADLQTPFFLSPTASQRLFHHDGEIAAAKAATAFGTAYSLSTIGSTSLEAVSAVCPGPKWFQLYVWRDRDLIKDVLARAKAAGFTGLILTVDMPVAGNRERDPRNQFTIPPRVNAKTATQALAKPGYLWRLATHPRIKAANFPQFTNVGSLMSFIDAQFDRSVTWEYADWLRQTWNGDFAVKGITHAEDARRCADIGAHVWVSNHGGRQLDSAPATIDVLEEIVAAVNGRVDVIFDGGVRRGADIVKALALGAKAVALGRAFLYGLGAGGQAGVERTLAILKAETERTLALIGCPRVRDLSPRFVRKPV